MAGDGGLLPEIKVGTSQREMVIHRPPRLPDGGMGQTFLVGTVTEVSAEEDRQPQRIKLSESCTLQVESAYGYLPQIAGIQTAVLRASYEQSPYALIEEDWGKLWHFKKGQRILVVLYLSEKELCFEAEGLMVLDARTAALPDILRRTALLPEEFTAADLEVLKLASPALYQQIFDMTAVEREMHAEETKRRREAVKMIVGIGILVVLGILIVRKVWKRTLAEPSL